MGDMVKTKLGIRSEEFEDTRYKGNVSYDRAVNGMIEVTISVAAYLVLAYARQHFPLGDYALLCGVAFP